jgi:hypothetical protein
VLVLTTFDLDEYAFGGVQVVVLAYEAGLIQPGVR